MQESNIKLKSLKRISPSRYTAINACAYKIALANSTPAPLLPYPPASHLGTIIHECLRLIVTNKIGTDEDFNNKWNQLLAQEEKKLKAMGFGFLVPLSENVPGYTIKKLQLKSLLKNRAKTDIPKLSQKPNISILTEKWLEAKDSLIGGFADMIIDLNGYIKLSDFKSGKILLAEGGVKEEYEEQLKLYAYLYNEEFDKYPNELSIIDLEEQEYAILYTPQECEELANKARWALSEINLLIENDEREALAKPNLRNCKTCLYRPACGFYWSIPPLEGDESVFRDIRGHLAAVKQFRNGNLNATLSKDGSEITISHINNEYLIFLTEVIGQEVAFYNVKQGGIPERYLALKTTKIYEI